MAKLRQFVHNAGVGNQGYKGETGLDPHSRSVFWLEQAEAEVGGRSCPPLTGAVTSDICIVGGGYTGLWTALEVLAHSPETRVTLIEASTCGFGASGRNGGWATSWYSRLGDLVDRFGPEQALWLADRSSEAIEWIEDFLTEHGHGQAFRQQGSILVAGGGGQEDRISAIAAGCEKHARGDLVEELDSAEVAAATGYEGSRGGLLFQDSAAIQPALLVRLLREEALRRGTEIYEATAMVALDRGRNPVVTTSAGQVTADVVVITTNAWAAGIRELRRSIVAVASHLVLTEPLDDRIDSLEWSRGTLLGDARRLPHYAQVTADGRIAFGRSGGVLGRRGRLLPTHFYDRSAIVEVAEDFRRWFPQLADVALTHAWTGPDDYAPGRLPVVSTIGDHENIHCGVGYSGNGVAPSALVGRILGRLALGIEDRYTGSGLVTEPAGYLPPEPIRHLGGTLLRNAIQRAEMQQEAGQDVGTFGRVARRLTALPTPRRWR